MELRIKEIMKQRGIKNKDLAAAVGMEPGNLILTLRRNMKLTNLEKIAEALGVQVFELFTTEEEVQRVRNERLARLTTPTATLICPCCGKPACVRMELS